MVVPFSVLDKMTKEEEKASASLKDEYYYSSSTTSSIGKDSDEYECGDTDNENEAESSYKYDEPLDMMDSLQHFLPIRRGISKFYDGKSKSFMSLRDAASSPSVQDIAKPENAYTRRRKILMAINHVLEKNRNSPLRSTNNGGISKRTKSSNRRAVALAFSINYDSSSSFTSDESTSSSNPRSPPPFRRNQVSSASSSPNSPNQNNLSVWQSKSLADF